MNYLIQAYACSPEKGGEYAVSWGWIRHLANVIDSGDAIYVLSLTLTEQDLETSGLKNVCLLPVEGMEKFSFLNYNALYEVIWQRKAYATVKKANLTIDVLHICSLSDFRMPGSWHKLKDTYKIFGPVGGGQICPKVLGGYDTGNGKIREWINAFYKWNPLYRNKIKKFDRIYACNGETKVYMPDSDILPDVPLRDDFRNLCIQRESDEAPVILCVGRLINKKGILLLLDVLKTIREDVQYKTLIYGDGEQKEIIRARIRELELQDKVELMGGIPYCDMSKIYTGGVIFVLPSLRESGGSVLIEAMAHKLPVVALDMSLSHILSERKCGLFVDIYQTKEEILQQFASNITQLIQHPDLRKTYGENGYRFVNTELNWDEMMRKVYGRGITVEDKY